MAVATTLRQTLASTLGPLLLASGFVDDNFEIVPGRLEGQQTDKDRGSIWVDTIEEDPDQKVFENIEVKLRVFKRFYASRGADLKPYDPSPLEALGEYVQTSLNTRQAALGPWQCRVTGQEFLIDEQGIEITLLGVHGNLAIRSFT